MFAGLTPMRILVLDSASGRRAAAVIQDGFVLAERIEAGTQGHEAVLPVMARAVLTECGGAIGLVAVTVGPGSFTGIRAGLALAHGIGLAAGVTVIGVTVGEAIADALPRLGRRALWIVADARRGHVFLERRHAIDIAALDALPMPDGPVAIAGASANGVAASLAAKGVDVMLTNARFAASGHIAAVAARRLAGRLAPLAAQPLYVVPPDAKLPAGGLRPPPEPVAR